MGLLRSISKVSGLRIISGRYGYIILHLGVAEHVLHVLEILLLVPFADGLAGHGLGLGLGGGEGVSLGGRARLVRRVGEEAAGADAARLLLLLLLLLLLRLSRRRRSRRGSRGRGLGRLLLLLLRL